MESRFKTEEINTCRCGFKPNYFSVFYGKTPYDIYCPHCKKQTARAKCKVTGWHGNVIDYWNKHIANLTKEELEKEVSELMQERKEKDPYGEFNTYEYYWEKDKGEVFYGR